MSRRRNWFIREYRQLGEAFRKIAALHAPSVDAACATRLYNRGAAPGFLRMASATSSKKTGETVINAALSSSFLSALTPCTLASAGTTALGLPSTTLIPVVPSSATGGERASAAAASASRASGSARAARRSTPTAGSSSSGGAAPPCQAAPAGASGSAAAAPAA
eukprot:CAMPEP_0113266660 /NCGR_PEP_ID=MMETSP0008_2-20120614/20181_2 /TAXON_ID=97485 /ORGANISM="Prymnesium parvum" /LENGTH=163 /DNA_ID=CAMNT_0000115615 /DNA_START=389 /DNA_END=877 /DNA_ORIENTATION=- /assembly_acc=CAM_ASM_000153